jgi:polyketide biosynthesis 3-hydroxy-3-methylglutaryl-CoA synthase-like enzyme PksG
MKIEKVGIESLNVFAGSAYFEVDELIKRRGFEPARFANLLMKQKSVALPSEDPVTFAVNAARPLIDALSPSERASIELLITCTESGLDFGKPLSSYVHSHLDLGRQCRLIELKSACYSGTAGLQVAVDFVRGGIRPGARALVVATDISRIGAFAAGDGEPQQDGWSFAEPSSGAGAVAMIVSNDPTLFAVDVGASGYYGYEVMDACRPLPDGDAGDPHLSILSYMDCCEQAFQAYQRRVSGSDFQTSFDYLAFHTPFAGLVKGAHRTMMRKLKAADKAAIDADFAQRVEPGIQYCQLTGNIMGATVLLALASTVDNSEFEDPSRVGLFSYGSGCCSEFFSGVVTRDGKRQLASVDIPGGMKRRRRLAFDDYDQIARGAGAPAFGVRNWKLDEAAVPAAAVNKNVPTLALTEIRNYHREYEWQ